MASASITWQSWSRKWGDWTSWTRNVTAPRPEESRTRVALENLRKQIQKAQPSTKIVSH